MLFFPKIPSGLLKYETHTSPRRAYVALRRKVPRGMEHFRGEPVRTFNSARAKFLSTSMVQEVRNGQQPETGQGRAQRHGSQ